MTLRGLLFDKDGTIFDFAATWGPWAAGAIADEAAGDPALAAALAKAIDFDLASGEFLPESPVIAGSPDEIVALMHPVLPAERRSGLLNRLETGAAQAPLAEVTHTKAFLDGLRTAGLHLGLLTNDAEAPTWEHLRAISCGDSFDFVAGYDSGFGAKPAPGGCLGFAQHCGLAPEDCAMIGDSLTDLRAGRAAGMRTVGVLTGPATRSDLEPHADVVLNSIVDLPGWLQQL